MREGNKAMKTQQITSMVLKAIRAGIQVLYFEDGDGYVWVSPDGCVCYRIPTCEVEFNLEKCEQNNKIADAIQNKGYICGKATGNMRRLNRSGKELILEIRSYGSPDVSAWINEKYIKPLECPSFRVAGEESIVLAYEYSSEEPCAGIMPMWYEQGDNRNGESNG